MAIKGINPQIVKNTYTNTSNKQRTENQFEKYIKNLSDQINASENQAAAVAAGKSDASVAETIAAIEQADLSIKMALAVNNKLVAAYKEIERMQI